jgi:serine/alanine adding enzyme
MSIDVTSFDVRRAQAVRSDPVVEPADDPATWDAYVESRAEATLYHLHAWKTVAERAYGMRAPFLVARDAPGGRVRGVLPLVRVARPFSPYLTTGVFGAYGPLLADTRVHARALVEEATRRVDAGEASFLHLKLLGEAPQQPGLERRDHWVTAQLELGASADQLWRALGSSMRAKIRHAQRAGLVAEFGKSGFDGFYDALSENMLRKGAPIYGVRFMRILLDALGPRADVVVLRHEGRVVSGALLAWFNGTMLVPFVSSRPSAFAMRPNNLLYWEIARRALELGLKVLDFGSSLRGSTGLQFKESWRPRIQPIGSYVYRGGGAAPPLVPTDSAIARNTVEIWSHLPPRVAERLGPRVCRWIA